ncbi:proline reductase cluster protein PrdD [[Clostridium] scindens]|uniref:proline reductase cluster protein PrdD n=1 Tax=Clostridium scindens (strain JCM 10418 / VPI 12708) TaxID=29347 RepID=UPI00242B8780|nr:proline reductase cluster protein PrdD [[Clostridium] scindens]
MNVGSRLTVKAYPVTEVCYGEENRVTVDGRMTVCKNIAEKILAQEPLIKEIDIRIIMPDEHRQHTNTVMDVIPLATKVLGRVGEGITHTLTGVYVILTGVDESGRQICNFGASDGILEEKIAWGRAGTPLRSDVLISFDVVLKEGSWADRPGPEAAHRACDTYCQIFREQIKKFNGYKCAEKHVFQETYEPGKKDVYIVKEVSGQGAVYDTRIFGHEPCGFEGGKSVIDMGCMPALVTPNEFRDGIMRAMD